ncbi:hypothetical protein A7985_08820 [Pseudoalteromonas luteoviolacea]|uniref:Uncharacterized protein n=1 Tax=Pseudoalteromonas luteoviolacea TaxID=43657 RepID=A0A1C0TRN2_9GAMM|nr:hypothetical protein [Pseudoalteromonas luteoviolacea]OCQ21901.1 hypothetical protein A7985_08820 [Pseudoalteromonas luteoviolacea]
MKKMLAALTLSTVVLPNVALATTATVYSYDQILTPPTVPDQAIYAHVDVVRVSTVNDFDFDGNNAALLPEVTYDDNNSIYYTGEGSQPRSIAAGEVVLHLQCNLNKNTNPGGYRGKASIAVTLEPGAEYELYAVQASKLTSWFGAPPTNFYACVPGIRKR